MLKPIAFKDAVSKLCEHQIRGIFTPECPRLYLLDNDGGIHLIDSFDLLYDRITCDDGYFDYIEYIVADEGNKDRLFVKEN